MERHLATPESIRAYNEFRANRKSKSIRELPDGLTKDEFMEVFRTLPDSGYTIPPELVPRIPS